MPDIDQKLKREYNAYEINRGAMARKNNKELKDGYQHQLNELKTYQANLNKSINKFLNISELKYVARQKQELSVALDKFVQDITLQGISQPSSIDDLTFSLFLCNRMLKEPTDETRINDFLNFTPLQLKEITNKETAYNVAKALTFLILLITGAHFLYRLQQYSFSSQKSSSHNKNFNFGFFSFEYNSKNHQTHKKQITDALPAMRVG